MNKKIHIILLILDIVLTILNLFMVYLYIIAEKSPFSIIIYAITSCIWAACAGMKLDTLLNY